MKLLSNIAFENKFDENKIVQKEQTSLTFLSIFINLYHYWKDKDNKSGSCSKFLPLINSFIERILKSNENESNKLLTTFALCEEAIWLLGYLWNEGYSLVEKTPSLSIKYLRVAANLALLSVKLIELNEKKQKELTIINDQQSEIEFLK